MATVAQALRFDGELASQLIAAAPRWLTVLLVALLGVRAATLVAGLAGGQAVMPDTGPPPPPVTRKVVDVPSILRANLFGQSAPVAGAAPVTSMALVLTGVIADSDEKLGFAMLGTSPSDIKFYRVGDTVPGGARLHAVLVDRVLLDRGGALEALLLPRRLGPGGTPVVIAPPPAASMDRVQRAMRDNPALIGQVMQRQPVFADGHLRGMRVYPGSNAQAFARLGLKPGDLVTAINGVQLEDQTRGNEIFDSLTGAAEARVTVTRNGNQQELVLNLAEVANEAEKLAAPPAGAGPGAGADAAGEPQSAR